MELQTFVGGFNIHVCYSFYFWFYFTNILCGNIFLNQNISFNCYSRAYQITMPRTNLGRRTRNATRVMNQRSAANAEQYEERTSQNRNAMRARRSRSVPLNFERAAFNYDSTADYESHRCLDIGNIDQRCRRCNALKFPGETPGLCCMNGKIKLPALQEPPPFLRQLLGGVTAESKHFLGNIQSYNSCFQMTSFGATNIIRDGYMPTFKVNLMHETENLNCICVVRDVCDVCSCFHGNDSINECKNVSITQIQGQVYHQVGSLLPFSTDGHKFLQIYFLGNSTDAIDRRCNIFENVRRSIIRDLQEFLHEENELVKLFLTAIERMPNDDHQIVIRPDKTPAGEHARRFNAPTNDEVAIIMVGEQFATRDIVLQRRNDQLQRVCETHRCYDALQYPILFPRGQDGYHLAIKMINPSTGKLMIFIFFKRFF